MLWTLLWRSCVWCVVDVLQPTVELPGRGMMCNTQVLYETLQKCRKLLSLLFLDLKESLEYIRI